MARVDDPESLVSGLDGEQLGQIRESVQDMLEYSGEGKRGSLVEGLEF